MQLYCPRSVNNKFVIVGASHAVSLDKKSHWYIVYRKFLALHKDDSYRLLCKKFIIFSLRHRQQEGHGDLISHFLPWYIAPYFFCSMLDLTSLYVVFLQLTSLSEGDREALGYILKAAIVIDDIFYEQVTSFMQR